MVTLLRLFESRDAALVSFFGVVALCFPQTASVPFGGSMRRRCTRLFFSATPCRSLATSGWSSRVGYAGPPGKIAPTPGFAPLASILGGVSPNAALLTIK